MSWPKNCTPLLLSVSPAIAWIMDLVVSVTFVCCPSGGQGEWLPENTEHHLLRATGLSVMFRANSSANVFSRGSSLFVMWADRVRPNGRWYSEIPTQLLRQLLRCMPTPCLHVGYSIKSCLPSPVACRSKGLPVHGQSTQARDRKATTVCLVPHVISPGYGTGVDGVDPKATRLPGHGIQNKIQ